MQSPYSFTVTDSSIAVVEKATGRTYTVAVGAPNYAPLKEAFQNGDWDSVLEHLEVRKSIEAWSKGNFKFEGGRILYKGEEIPGVLGKRIRVMAERGEDVDGLLKFWELLKKNPSMRAVEGLYNFLQHEGIPIGPNGHFRAYKGVNENMTDKHSGRVDNRPGTVNAMDRNKVSDDPRTPCHYGYHVGALAYAKNFASVTVICEVSPEDVVCIPYDHSQQKMRVCRYTVVGLHNGDLMDSTAYDLEPELGTGAEVQPVGDEDDLEIIEGTPIEDTPRESATSRAVDEEDKERASDEVPRCKNWPDGATEHVCETCNPEAVAKLTEESKTEGWSGSVEQKDSYKEKPKKPAEKKMKKPRDADKKITLKVAKKYRAIHDKDFRGLMDESVADLREYASKVLSIVGVSKIIGGKAVLVKKIITTRKHFNFI